MLARALAKDPEDATATCGDFADALRAALSLDPYDPSRAARHAGTAAVPSVHPGLHRAAADAGRRCERTARAPPPPPRPDRPWTAVITADRAYYDSVQRGRRPDTASISLPRRLRNAFPLTGAEVRIGRRSASPASSRRST